MSATRDKLKSRRRPARTVDLPGGGAVPVCDLTIGQLRSIDQRAAEVPDGPERQIRYLELFAVYALVEDDGLPAYPDRSAEDMADVAELLTPAELAAVAEALVPTKAAAKN